MFVLLEHARTKQRLVVGNTHLFWDPRYPHIKAAQAELACAAARSFIEGRAVEGAPPPAFVLAGDFNSVPHMQPAFLPASQAAALPQPLPAKWGRSATYELLTQGYVAPGHPEHPDSFGKRAAVPDAPELAPPPRKKQQLTSPGLGPLHTGLPLRDGYEGALCAGPLPLSTHADDFAGCLDYIWVSTAEGTEPGSVGSSGPVTRDGGRDGRHGTACSPVDVLEVLDMPYSLASPEAFGKIPSAEWPSDHLALGALLSLPQLPEHASRAAQH